MRILPLAGLVLLVALPALSTAFTLPPGAVVLPDGAIAVPDVAPPPAWWTPDVQQKAAQAGRLGLGYDHEADRFVDVAAAYPSQALIRPGTQLLIYRAANGNGGAQGPDGPRIPVLPDSWCTAAFVLDGRDKITTAGHCVGVNDLVSAVAAPSTIITFGKTVASTGNGGIGNDWAVIDVDPAWEAFVDADVAWLSGPCGVVTTDDITTLQNRAIKMAGHGAGIGTGGTPRAGLLTALRPTFAAYTTATMGGDSGSPVLLSLDEPVDLESCAGEGQALVIHTHTQLCAGEASLVCTKYGTRITLVPGTVANGNLLPN